MVEADYKGKGKYYAGRVSRVRANGTYDIDYDDGEKELAVPRSMIKSKAKPRAREDSEEAVAEELKIGSAVEADYKGKGKYYAGRIARVRLNGTYDIDYDDGEKELGVPKSMIKSKARYV